MAAEEFTVESIARVVGGRTEPTDDYWGGTRAVIRVDGERFTPEATKGLEESPTLRSCFASISPIPLT